MGGYGMTTRPGSPYLFLVKLFRTNSERRRRVNQCHAIHINFGSVLGPLKNKGTPI